MTLINRMNSRETPYIMFYRLRLDLVEMRSKASSQEVSSQQSFSVASSICPPAAKVSKEENRRRQQRESKQRQRESDDHRAKERETDQVRKRIARQDTDLADRERQADQERRRMSRLDSQLADRERQADRERRRMSRLDSQLAERERQADQERRRIARQDSAIAERERQADQERRHIARQDSAKAERERQADQERRHIARQDSAKAEKERLADQERRRTARQDQSIRVHERSADNLHKKSWRDNMENRRREQRVNTLAHFNVRHSAYALIMRYEDSIKNGPTVVCVCCGGLFFQHYMEPFDEEGLCQYLGEENMQRIKCVPSNRSDPQFLCKNCLRYVVAQKMPPLAICNGLAFPQVNDCILRLNELEERIVSPRIAFTRIRSLAYPELQKGLRGNVVNVPLNVDETLKMLPRQVNQCEQIHLDWMRKMGYTRPYMTSYIRPSAIFTAIRHLNAIPGGAFQHADISIAEETEWQTRASEEINQSSQSEQISISEVVDEFADQSSSMSTLDRIMAEELSFRSIYSIGALKDLSRPPQTNNDSLESKSGLDIDEESDEYYDRDPENVAQQTVVLNEQDYAQNVSLAPAAYQRPITLAYDTYGEELTFLKIYGGELRDHELIKSRHISYSSQCKSEFRRYDRRCAENPSKLFYSYRKLIQLNLASSINISMRKTRKAMKIQRHEALSPEFMQDLLFKNEAQLLFRNIRSSPSYWDARKKDINAMIRTLGSPSLFITLSPAEVMWPELIRLLIQVLKKPKDKNSGFDSYDRMTDDQLLKLPKEKLYALISKDPITVARYFDHRFACLRNYMFDKHGGPFKDNPIVDYDYRIEFHNKGSPHAHMLVWNRDAPEFDKYEFITRDRRLTYKDGYGAVNDEQGEDKSYEEGEPVVTESQLESQMSQQFRSEKMQQCLAFVDKYICCARPSGDTVSSTDFLHDSDLHEKYDKTCTIQLQVHSHRANCRLIESPGDYRACKYGFPKPILEQSMILEPLPLSLGSERLIFFTQKWREIRDTLAIINREGDNSEIKSLDQLLSALKMDKSQYILSIRASIKTITVFLRRQYNELMINNYMPEVYVRHRGNMDIQYITDPYGAAVYVSAYMLKSNAIMSVLLKRAIFDISRGDMPLRAKFSAVASKFSNANEISAQECAYQILSMRVSKASRQVLFVNTLPPTERYAMLKERAQLEAQAGSPFCNTLLDYYVARPDSMENICWLSLHHAMIL